MIRKIQPSGPLRRTVRVPGSKSITNRALVCAALADGESHVVGASDSDDTARMANGLDQFGVLVRPTSTGLAVRGTGGSLQAPKFPIPVGNAGTTLRFLLSVATLAQGRTVLEGSTRMAERPTEELLEALRTLGADVRQSGGGARFEVTGRRLTGGAVSVSGARSSQFVSSILLASPYAEHDVTLNVVDALSSESYVDMTQAVMKAFGVSPETDRRTYIIRAGRPYRPCTYTVEPDASSSTYAFAAAAITGGEVTVEGVRRGTMQADAGFLEVLARMGCTVTETDRGVTLARIGALRGVDVDMNRMPDSVPALAAVALFAEGATHVRNVAHLRFKESDRIEALCTELSKLGASVTPREDGLDVQPAPLRGALLDTYDDHRLAMSFAVIGLAVPGVEVENPDCVRKSFPRFWDEIIS